MAEENYKSLGVGFINECSRNHQDQLSDVDPQAEPLLARCPWYKDVIYFLQELRPPNDLQINKARALKLKAVKYFLIDQILYWKDPLGVILKCMDPQEADKIIVEFHSSLCGGHHFWKTTAYKILRDGYYWTTLFTDVCKKIRACIKCKKFSELDTTGPPSSPMFIKEIEPVSHAKDFQENNNASLCLYSL